MSPIVGISMCLDARGRWREGRDYVYIDRAYADAVSRAGGTPIHLPPQPDAEALVSRLDALLIPGGDDFPPPDAERDRYDDACFDLAPDETIAFDERLLAEALRREIPVLGICYGMQLIALQHGGSLLPHLPTDRPEAGEHRLPEDARHDLEVEPGTRLAGILGDAPDARRVNSLHHQAVGEPGAGLVVGARSPDGVVEALEAPGARFLVGVQWHPEKLPDSDPGRLALFGAFVDAARGR